MKTLLILLSTVLLYPQDCPKETTVWEAIGWSSGSGISLGAHESFTFGYKYSGWMPKFMTDWYNSRPNTDAVFGKLFSWQKIFRDADYAFDRRAWDGWKNVFKVKTIWSWNFLLAFVSHWGVKNFTATLIRDRFKHDDWLYSIKEFNTEINIFLPFM